MRSRSAAVQGRVSARPAWRRVLPDPKIGAVRDIRTAAFLEHRAGLLRYLQARGVGSEAEDILQELWLRMSAATSEISEPRAYLFRSAHNLLLDRVRERQRRAARERDFQLVDGQDRSIGGAPRADLSLIARQRLRAIDRTLVALGSKTDAIFRQFRLDKIPQQEIADARGISISAVEKHLQKAYKAIADVQRHFDAEDMGDFGPDTDVAE